MRCRRRSNSSARKCSCSRREDLAWGDLSHFTAIVTGVRAYERRDDLRANNSRLLDYVFKGGTHDRAVQQVRVQRRAVRARTPRRSASNRVTDENAPVQTVVAHSPLLTTPNEIGEAAWKNWVQERGTYFLAEDKDSRYHDVVRMEDNFPYNKGMKTGALVEAQLRQGALGLRRAGPVAPAPGRHRRRVSAPREPHLGRETIRRNRSAVPSDRGYNSRRWKWR